MLNNKEDIAVYFHDHVLKPYRDFIECKHSPEIGGGRDLRAALNAAEAIYHFREQLGAGFKVKCKDIMAKCPDYALARDVTNFKKHRRHDRKSRLRRADPIQEMIVTTIYRDELGEYYNSVKEFKVHLKDGTSRALSEVLTNAINFWCDYLDAQNVEPKFGQFSMPNALTSLPRSKCKSVANMTIAKGLRFGPEYFLLQRYNYNTGGVEPMDLTGYKARLRAFQPRHEIGVVLENKSTGEQLQETVVLSPNQSDEFDALKSDEERQNYLSKLPEVISAHARLASQAAESSKISKQPDEGRSRP
jgi:hypothetical protein